MAEAFDPSPWTAYHIVSEYARDLFFHSNETVSCGIDGINIEFQECPRKTL
jgi:hypothetical protein